MSWTGAVVAALVAAGAAVPWIRERNRSVMDDEARRAAPGRFVRLSRGVTHYRWSDNARGPVAVMVHGLTTPSYVWDGLEPVLMGLGYRVLRYDLYGRGFSDRPSGRQDPDVFVTQLAELLADQGIEEEITLFGYSMGGVIATAFADTYPEKLRRLVLLAPAGMGHALDPVTRLAVETPLLGTWAFHMTYPRAMRRGVEAERDVPKSVPGIGEMQLQEMTWRGYLPAVLSSLRHTLRRPIEARHRRVASQPLPVLAIWGEDDKVIPIRCLGRLAEWNRYARQDVVKGAGHGLVYTHPQAIAEILVEALEAPPI